MFRCSLGFPLGTNNQKPTQLGENSLTNPSKHIESSDLLNKFTIILIHQIIRVMKILILIDFDKWFNMLHLKKKKKLAEALDSKKLCSLALDSRVCTWTKKGWNTNWRFDGVVTVILGWGRIDPSSKPTKLLQFAVVIVSFLRRS